MLRGVIPGNLHDTSWMNNGRYWLLADVIWHLSVRPLFPKNETLAGQGSESRFQ